MATDKNKGKLLQFLDQKVFNPVLRASPKKYSENERKKLELVKRKTETEKKRYRTYKSAGQVRQEFKDDLHSEPAKKTNANLKQLGLPRLKDFRKEFIELADDLGVTEERETRRHHRPHPPHPWHKSKPEERKKAWSELMKLYREDKLPEGKEKRAAAKHSQQKKSSGRKSTAKRRKAA